MDILLDTCAFLWLVNNSSELSDQARKLFSDPKNEVFLSVISAWEVGVKYNLGKMPLPTPPSEFIPRQKLLHRIKNIDLTEADVLQVENLPSLHKDPFDRLLVCQALARNMTILTQDKLISQYPVKTVW